VKSLLTSIKEFFKNLFFKEEIIEKEDIFSVRNVNKYTFSWANLIDKKYSYLLGKYENEYLVLEYIKDVIDDTSIILNVNECSIELFKELERKVRIADKKIAELEGIKEEAKSLMKGIFDERKADEKRRSESAPRTWKEQKKQKALVKRKK
jgi:hypothetical protein